jgi:hypothetical protein
MPTNPNNRRLSAKLVPTFADRRCHVVSTTDPYVCILDFYTGATTFSSKQLLDFTLQSHYFSEILVAPLIEPDLCICSQEL